MDLESIFKWILGVGLGTHRIQSTHPEEGKFDSSRAPNNSQLDAGYRLQPTNYSIQACRIQGCKGCRMQDAGYKMHRIQDTGYRIQQMPRSLVALLKRGRRIYIYIYTYIYIYIYICFTVGPEMSI